MAREGRTQEEREGQRALPGNRHRAPPEKEGPGGRVWTTKVAGGGVLSGEGGTAALAPEGGGAARPQGAPEPVCLGRAR